MLRLLLIDFPRGWSAADLAIETGYAKVNVAATLDSLALTGVVRIEKSGNQFRYRLARPSQLIELAGPMPSFQPDWSSRFSVMVNLLRVELEPPARQSLARAGRPIAQSWNLIMGYGGIYSFAQVALFAVGGWTAAVLASSLGWNPFVAVLFSPVIAVVAAVGIGLPTLRLRGVYVVLMTLAFHELARVFAVTGPRFLSGGGYGLVNVPTFQFGNVIGEQRTIYLYYLAMVIFAIATLVIWRVIHSPLGMAVTALRDSETYAVSRGINQLRIRLILFAISAFFTGFAGGYMTHYNGGISTSVFDFPILIDLLAMIVIGGWGTFGGPILGAAIIIGLDQYLVAIGDYSDLFEGLIIAVIAVFAPQGLWPLIRRTYDKYLGPEPPAPAVSSNRTTPTVGAPPVRHRGG